MKSLPRSLFLRFSILTTITLLLLSCGGTQPANVGVEPPGACTIASVCRESQPANVGVVPLYDPRNLRTRAGQDNPVAQYNLAEAYATGDSVPQDFAAAAHWYLQAAEQDHTGGQIGIGTAYWLGRGVRQDYREAYIWFSIAVMKNDHYRFTAIVNRDAVAADMSSAELSAAQADVDRRLSDIRRRLQ